MFGEKKSTWSCQLRRHILYQIYNNAYYINACIRKKKKSKSDLNEKLKTSKTTQRSRHHGYATTVLSDVQDEATCPWMHCTSQRGMKPSHWSKISYYSQNSRENRDMLFRGFAAIVQGHATPPPQNKYTKEKQIISQTNYCYFIFNSFWWDTFQLGVNMKHCFRKKKNPLDFQILSAYSASQSSSGITNLKIIFSERS